MVNKVKGYRNMLNLSQADMAQILNMSKRSYSLKESGKREFKDKEKIAIKEMIIPLFPNITIEDIFFNQ